MKEKQNKIKIVDTPVKKFEEKFNEISIIEKEQIAYLNFRQMKTLTRRKSINQAYEYGIMTTIAK